MSTITRYTNSGHKFIIDGYVAVGNTVTITVVPIDGYRFSEWTNDDGNSITELDPDSEGHRVFSVTINECGFSLVALFQEIEDDCDRESIYNEFLQILGNSNSPSTELPWDSSEDIDCDTIEEEIIKIIGGTTPPTKYTITVNANTGGTATGGGIYSSGTDVTITATANSGYSFTKWDDDDTNSTRTITVTGNATYTAYFTTNTYRISTGVNPIGGGTATGGGLYSYGATATLGATANPGYTFTKWTDGITNNPRTITVAGNATYTAEFTVNNYTITTSAHPTNGGTTTGSGTYAYGANVRLEATADSTNHYHFENWTENGIVVSTANPYNFTMGTSNRTLVGNFALDKHTLTVNTNNSSYGTVTPSGARTYNCNTVVSVTATPATHYHFDSWSDGGLATHDVTVNTDKIVTATFAIDKHTITVYANTGGSATGGGLYDYNSTATLTATPRQHYRFVMWDDGSTNNPRQVTVTGDATYTAIFEINNYTITAEASPEDGGNVNGGGSYDYGTDITLTATANPGYTFIQWDDGVRANSRRVTVTGDATYTAEFTDAEVCSIRVLVNPTDGGTATGDGTYIYGTNVTLEATANPGYTFSHWNDSDNTNPRTIMATNNETYTAEFTSNDYTVTTMVNQAGSGTVTGSGTFKYKSKIVLTAVPTEGYVFSKWNDGNTESERYITVTDNATYTAYFIKES